MILPGLNGAQDLVSNEDVVVPTWKSNLCTIKFSICLNGKFPPKSKRENNKGTDKKEAERENQVLQILPESLEAI